MRRIFAWAAIVAGAAAAVGGAAVIFTEPELAYAAGGGAAVGCGLALLALGVATRR